MLILLRKGYLILNQQVLNESALADNPYPGRGIIMGVNDSGTEYVQVYWLMGRSENSRNRIFAVEENMVKTKPFDPSKVEDPSLIIYNAMREINGNHIVTNGDQTDTIAEFITLNKSFEQALETRDYEPDAPNYTPRISGVLSPDKTVKMSALRRVNGTTQRDFWQYDNINDGQGQCIHTYLSDRTPLPSFDQEPFMVTIPGGIKDIADKFWNLLDEDNRISLVVKTINKSNGEVNFHIINKLGDEA